MPNCSATGCGTSAVVQWTRRPTEAEFTAMVATETARREMAALLADPQLGAPDFGPMPAAGSTLVAIYACAPHAISHDVAAHVHAATCSAPPACTCSPEAIPENSGPGIPADNPNLPAGW